MIFERTGHHRAPKAGEWVEDLDSGAPTRVDVDWPPELKRWILAAFPEPQDEDFTYGETT